MRKGMPELKAVVEGLAGALAVMAIVVAAGALVVFAQAASPQGTPQGTPVAEPSAKPTKNPHIAHHHFDVRHPHKSTRPQVANPQESPDPPYDPFTGGPNVNKPQEH